VQRRLIYSPIASRALQELEAYISAHESVEIAADYIERIEVRCRRLLIAPEQGTRQDQYRTGVRTTGFERRITIAFRVTSQTVRILSIAYGGRRYQPDI
jgi:toxin ParE1/3/4